MQILNWQYITQINSIEFLFQFHSYLNMTQITWIVGMQCVHNNYIKILSAVVNTGFCFS